MSFLQTADSNIEKFTEKMNVIKVCIRNLFCMCINIFTWICLQWKWLKKICEPKTFQQSKEDCCSICLSAPRLELLTNCGHVFCGPCLRSMWILLMREQQFITCPMCRMKLYRLTPVKPNLIIYSNIMASERYISDYLTLYDFKNIFNYRYKPLHWSRLMARRFRHILNIKHLNKLYVTIVMASAVFYMLFSVALKYYRINKVES